MGTENPIWNNPEDTNTWHECARRCQLNPSCKTWTFTPHTDAKGELTGDGACRIMLTKLNRVYSGEKACGAGNAFGECPSSYPYAWAAHKHCCDEKPRGERCFWSGAYLYNAYQSPGYCCRNFEECPKGLCRNNKRVG